MCDLPDVIEGLLLTETAQRRPLLHEFRANIHWVGILWLKRKNYSSRLPREISLSNQWPQHVCVFNCFDCTYMHVGHQLTNQKHVPMALKVTVVCLCADGLKYRQKHLLTLFHPSIRIISNSKVHSWHNNGTCIWGTTWLIKNMFQWPWQSPAGGLCGDFVMLEIPKNTYSCYSVIHLH